MFLWYLIRQTIIFFVICLMCLTSNILLPQQFTSLINHLTSVQTVYNHMEQSNRFMLLNTPISFHVSILGRYRLALLSYFFISYDWLWGIKIKHQLKGESRLFPVISVSLKQQRENTSDFLIRVHVFKCAHVEQVHMHFH